jgi:hypothetical protein
MKENISKGTHTRCINSVNTANTIICRHLSKFTKDPRGTVTYVNYVTIRIPRFVRVILLPEMLSFPTNENYCPL